LVLQHTQLHSVLYIDLNATAGTSSHFRNTDGSTTWAAMSDD